MKYLVEQFASPYQRMKVLIVYDHFPFTEKEQINLKSNNEKTNWSIMNIDTQSEQKKGILEVDCWGSYVHSSSMH